MALADNFVSISVGTAFFYHSTVTLLSIDLLAAAGFGSAHMLHRLGHGGGVESTLCLFKWHQHVVCRGLFLMYLVHVWARTLHQREELMLVIWRLHDYHAVVFALKLSQRTNCVCFGQVRQGLLTLVMMLLLAVSSKVITAAAVVWVLRGNGAWLSKVSRVPPRVQVRLKMLLKVRLVTLLSIRVLIKPALVLGHLVLILSICCVQWRWYSLLMLCANPAALTEWIVLGAHFIDLFALYLMLLTHVLVAQRLVLLRVEVLWLALFALLCLRLHHAVVCSIFAYIRVHWLEVPLLPPWQYKQAIIFFNYLRPPRCCWLLLRWSIEQF